MTTTSTAQLLRYECTLGLSAMTGRGFYYPTDTVIGNNGRLYVVNRSVEIVEIGVRVTICDMDSEFYGTFGHYGQEDGQFIWHAAGAMDSQGHIHLLDEYLHRVSAFDADGNFLQVWGTHGSGEGELDGPCGIAIDTDDALYISDTYNNRVQKFTASGVHLATIGEGTLSMPWKLTVAPSGDLYVADWGNDRIARFTADGEFVAILWEARNRGRTARQTRKRRRRCGGQHLCRRLGATSECKRSMPTATSSSFCAARRLSPCGRPTFLNINREEGEARSRADLELDLGSLDPDDPHDVSSKIEKYFWSPVSVKLDGEGRLFVTESNRARVQVYRVAS